MSNTKFCYTLIIYILFPGQVNPFERILAQEYWEKIENAKLVAVFHELPMTAAALFAARIQLDKINLVYLKHNNTVSMI